MMKRMKNKWFLILLISFLQVHLSADTLTYTAATMKTGLARGNERTLLDGNVIIESTDIDITADHVEIYGKNNNFIYCEGNIFTRNKKSGVEITCEKMYYDRDKNVIRIHGNAHMEDKKNEIVIKGDYIEHWDDKSETIIQIGVRILKENMVCRSESARYYREDKRLELTGMPVVVKEGDEFKALKIIIDLENDNVEMEGSVKGEIAWEDEEENAEAEPGVNLDDKIGSAGSPADSPEQPGNREEGTE